jgi:hypothetical protein
MEPPGGRPSLHRLIGEAVLRGARLQEESREAVEATKASSAALARTVADVHRDRARRRKFGNGQFDAEQDGRAG